jgi:phosphonate transport system substrate-binding protein
VRTAETTRQSGRYEGCFWSWVLVVTLFLVTGCDQGGEVKHVDFNRTLAVAERSEESSRRSVLRAAVGAMISPQETHEIYLQLLAYTSRKLDMELKFVQRKTYAEVNELLGKDELDLAFICSGPFALGRQEHGFRLLATPVVHGERVYRSYLIVNQDSPYQNLQDLRGTLFAFTDPHSNTGRLVPTYWLARIDERPETFFQDVIFTYSHDHSIQAVAQGLVDAAAVDSLIWEYYARANPTHTGQTRIIKRSAPYGIPPVVISSAMPEDLAFRIQDLLLHMHEDPEGMQILNELMIDRFVQADSRWYDSIKEMAKTVADIQGTTSTP